MSRLFGTDGVRGVAITELTPELALNIGKALTAYLVAQNPNHTPCIIIGKDTRMSSDCLEAALIAGITAAGGLASTAGIVPTPAVAYLVQKHKADAGVMITASHNPAEFNGIKLFDRNGFKFPDSVEDEMELLIHSPESIPLKDGRGAGAITSLVGATLDYVNRIVGISDCSLDELKILVDCANGCAALGTAKQVFNELKADCTVINASPDGTNINDKCGSTYIESLKERVLENKFDIGIAFDGDADRMLAIDDTGAFVDGDKIIALLSAYMKQKGELKDDTAVVTVMSNLGFHSYMKANGLKTKIVSVGDRYVTEMMLAEGFSLGGEQSGHIIFGKHSTTGDGILTAVKLLNLVKTKNSKLSELVAEIPSFPQTLKNVTIATDKKNTWENNSAIVEVIKQVESEGGGKSRILVRESGTEPLLRVMLEGENQEQIEDWADRICEVARKELGA
ncbi:MAG: phosphoglucosamine mutase [Oscillospiraceae bacterium]|nr:phosphoglucosamine mutase [Oscillospiraceae bacterium]